MANKDFILDLGKLMIGIAWTDGQLHPEEINALKELLFLLPDISGEDWRQLELYMTHAVTEVEREELLKRVLNNIRSASERDLALSTLAKLMTVEGGTANAEVIESIRQDLETKSTGLLAHIMSPLKKSLKSRASHYSGASSREDRIEDFIKNTIFYQLSSELEARDHKLDIPENEVRKICLAAGLMAHVAWVDNEVCHREREAMSLGLQQLWDLPKDEADLITDMSHTRIMHGLDLVRLTTGFCEYTTIDERKAFLQCLFAIANAATETSHEEIEEIRRIAKALELPHQEFINAKLTIPREERGGL
ncbi:TerB family tellurite resistance protein [Candidatus Nitronereus thalassa]|uniref:TerB family tellurite resistance protein n=1 Tax=Candidatus Nitronereus thalassa TaxID=3020898 RepID=A0ABU3K8L3_9BACT|nr:TerB family tellurite resistance protein [Candidatus Nitronereus thalassa]MDT7042653.1 TerB family tellurite resistance protein [Candidatus Nitronereus thalassa]